MLKTAVLLHFLLIFIVFDVSNSFRGFSTKYLSYSLKSTNPLNRQSNSYEKVPEKAGPGLNKRVVNIKQNTKPINYRRNGPLPRKKFVKEDIKSCGRVSVYYVGSSIDLTGLRSHVFRKKFDNGDNNGINRQNEDFDEKYVHLWNSPICIAPDKEDDKEKEKRSDNSEEDTTEYQEDELDSKTKEIVALSTQDIYYFQYGCIVFWGLTAAEEKAALTELSPFIKKPVTSQELEEGHETMEYVFDQSVHQKLIDDQIKLRTLQPEEKLAFSYAMAQSSKLYVFESKVSKSVETTRHLPRELATHGKIQLNKKELTCLMGQLFLLQTEINLFSSILDTPDFLWDEDEHFNTYVYTKKYFEIDKRVELLNDRLKVLREFVEVLRGQMSEISSRRLEWIMIWFMAIEVVLGFVKSNFFPLKLILQSLLFFLPSGYFLYKKLDQ